MMSNIKAMRLIAKRKNEIGETNGADSPDTCSRCQHHQCYIEQPQRES